MHFDNDKDQYSGSMALSLIYDRVLLGGHALSCVTPDF